MPTASTLFNEALSRVLEILREPLHFQIQSTREFLPKFVFPTLDSSSNSGTSVRDSSVSNCVLNDIFDRGTGKFVFNNTTRLEWDRFVAFSSQKLLKDGDYFLGPQDTTIKEGDSINRSSNHLRSWIRANVIRGVTRSSRNGYKAVVLGDPGSGKSTIIKYALNVYRNEFLGNKIVVSRFESVKYWGLWKKRYPDRLMHDIFCLHDYISWILLRDLIDSECYEYDNNNISHKKKSGVFGSRAAIQRMVTELPIKLSTQQETDLYYAIDYATAGRCIDYHYLLDIPVDIRRCIIMEMKKKYKYRYLLILDGLDFVSIEDGEFNKDVSELLKNVLRELGRPMGGGVLDSDLNAIFVLRENTYTELKNSITMDIHQNIDKFYVEPVDMNIALFNALRRGVFSYYSDKGGDYDSVANDIYRAAQVLFKYVGINLGLTHSESVLHVFNNNIRDCFGYVSVVIDYIVTGFAGNGMTDEVAGNLQELLRYLLSERARRVLRMRGYRLTQLLLFSQGGMYRNSLIQDEAFGEDGKLVTNPDYCGFVDNIYDYHSVWTQADRDSLTLLEKIRILQLLKHLGLTRGLTANEIDNAMYVRFGYAKRGRDGMRFVLKILLRGGFLVQRLGEDGLRFVISRKGDFCLGHVLMSATYIEHIFHKTLFPEMLVANVADSPRDADVDKWVVRSIRNSFIFLKYLEFVESNTPRGVSVPDSFRIAGVVRESVLKWVERICSSDFKKNRDRTSETWIVVRARDLVEKQLQFWSGSNVL